MVTEWLPGLVWAETLSGVASTRTMWTKGRPAMPLWKLLPLVNLAAAFDDVGTIVSAQVDRQLWRYVGRDTFPRYHRGWWHGVWWSVFPVLGISTMGARRLTEPGLCAGRQHALDQVALITAVGFGEVWIAIVSLA